MAKGFVKGVKSELKKVVWPTKQQLIKSTTMVIFLIVVFSVVIIGLDTLLELGVTHLWIFIHNKLA